MEESPKEWWGQQSNISSGHRVLHQSVNQSIFNQPINQSTIQNNTIQTLSTLPEEGFSVTMIIRRNKSKIRNCKITIMMKCFIKNIKKAKMLINIH